MSWSDLASFVAAAPVVAAFWWAVGLAGRAVVRLLGFRPAQPHTTHLALGLGVLYLAAWVLSAAGWFRPFPLAALVLVLGVIGAPAGVARLARAIRRMPRLEGPLAVVAGSAVAVALLLTLMPVFHYDLTANYLGIARQYLLQGHLGPLPHDVHSSTSTFLHVLAAVLLALGEPLRTWSPNLAAGHVYSVFLVSILGLAAGRVYRLAQLLTLRAADAAVACGAATVLWFSMPQTTLLYALKSAELISVWLALTAAASALEPRRRLADSTALGVLLGLMLATKLQLAPVVAAAAVVAGARRPRHLPVLTAGLLVGWGPSVLRALLAYGNPLHPFLSGEGTAGRAARLLLAENATQPSARPFVVVRRLVSILTRQPETGITIAAALPAALARPRRGGAIVLVLLPALTIAAASEASVNALRWMQPVIPVALVLSAAALVRIDRRLVTWGAGAAAALSLLIALPWLDGMIGLARHLHESPRAWVAGLDSLQPLREELATQPGRTLWVGVGESLYTSPDDLVPSVHDAAALSGLLEGATPASIARRLRGEGFSHLVWDHRQDRRLMGGTGGWEWASPDERRALARLVTDPAHSLRRGRVTVLRIGPPSAPASPPSPP